jgi:hypothetical protein
VNGNGSCGRSPLGLLYKIWCLGFSLCASSLLAVLSLSAGLNTALCVSIPLLGGAAEGANSIIHSLRQRQRCFVLRFRLTHPVSPPVQRKSGSKPPPPALLIANGFGCSLQAQQTWTNTAENSRSAAAPWIRAPASSLHVASAGIEVGRRSFLSQLKRGVQQEA